MGGQQSVAAPQRSSMSAEEVAALTAECEKRFEKCLLQRVVALTSDPLDRNFVLSWAGVAADKGIVGRSRYMVCVERHQQGKIKGLRLDDCEEESAAYRECQKRMPKRQR